MKGLYAFTVKAHWGLLIRTGLKTVENRNFRVPPGFYLVHCAKAQRGGLAKFASWCAQAPDAERRVIMLLMGQYQGRVPMGAVADVSGAAGVSRMTVFNAIRRFVSFFPGAISDARRSKG